MARPNWFSSRRTLLLNKPQQRKPRRLDSGRKSNRLRLESLEDRLMLSATVATDQADYLPGALAHIIASDFAIGEAVQFQVLHNDGTPNTGNGHLPWTVVDGGADDLDGLVDGNIHTTWYVDPDDSIGSSFELSTLGLSTGSSATTTFTDAGGSTLSQFANKPSTQYQTGSLNSSNSAYVEGNSIPFRFLVSNLREGAFVVLDIIYQFQSSASGPRTYDFLTSDTASEAITDTQRFGPSNASKPNQFDLTSSTNLVVAPIPDDPSITTDTGGNFRIASNVPVTVTSVSTPAISTSPDEKHIVLVIQLGNDGDATPNENIVDLGVFWGGHLARDTDYAGANNGAADAPGASFHMRTEGFEDLNGNGNRDSGEDNLSGGDRSIGNAIVHTTLAWEKRRADTNALQGGATFTVTPNPFTGSGSLTVVDDIDGVTDAGDVDHDPNPGQFLLEDFLFGTYTITEVVAPAGFFIDPDPTRMQSVTSASPNAVVGTQGQNDPGTTDESDFHDPPVTPAIDIEKLVNGQDADTTSGQPILPVGSTATFTYIVTNTGNVALSNVVVVDDNGTPANSADDFNPAFTGGDTNSNGLLDLTETWTFTASRIVTAGQYTNIAKATGQALGQSVMDSDAANHFGKSDPIIVIGPDKGNASYPIVKLVDQATGNIITQFYVYEPNFLGGVRIATGDMTGDGIDEIIVAPGQGRVGEVRVFTQLGIELTQFRTLAYGAAYMGGIEVALGDVNGDGKNDIVTTPSYGRTEVRVFYNNFDSANPSADPIDNSPNKQFFVFASSFLGGADVIVADVGTFHNGATLDALTPDGKGEIIVGNGPGMRSTIVVFDVSGAPSVIDTILPFSNSFKGGITLSTARVNGDGIPDFIVAAGNLGGSGIEIWSGLTNDAIDVRLAAFASFGNVATKNAPVHTTALDINGDGIADLLAVVQGTNGKSNQIRYFSTAGTPLGLHSGFIGPWNIASLNNADSSLPTDKPIEPAARDEVYSGIATSSSTSSKVSTKKLAKAKKKK